MDTSLSPSFGHAETLGMDLSLGAGIFERMHVASAPSPSARTVRLVLDVPAAEEAWVLPEEDMPESSSHRDTVHLLELILLAFVARTGRSALLARNLACRWFEEDARIGVDPDIALIEPAPPDAHKLPSLRTWQPGHVPPRFAIEVVSASNSDKDYQDAPAKYAAMGTRELVVFDPDLSGPHTAGGPYVLQVWRRNEGDTTAGGQRTPAMVRVHAGAGPARSEELDAWLIPMSDGRLRIAEDEQGLRLWPTEAEEQSAARQQEAAARQQEAAARQQEAAARQQEAAARQAAEAARLATARAALLDMCELLDVPLDDTRRAFIASLDADRLESLRAELKQARTWPR